MAVEAYLGVGADLGHKRGDPCLGVGQDQCARRVDYVDALGTCVDHDPRLPGKLARPDPVREHEEAHGLHAEVARGGEVLDGNVGLRAVRSDPCHRGANVMRMAEVVDGAYTRQQEYGDRGLPSLVDGGGDQVELVDLGEAVIER